MPLLEAEYIDTGKVRYVTHPYYLEQFGTLLATEAAWCAADQGKFFEYSHALFERQGSMPLDQNALTNLAAEVGLDANAMTQCLANGTHRNDVAEARQAALNRGITSTPTFFINNRRVDGNQPYEVFKQIIEQELAAAQ